MTETKGASGRSAWQYALYLGLLLHVVGCRFGEAPGDGLDISFPLNTDGSLDTTESAIPEDEQTQPATTTPAVTSNNAGRAAPVVSAAGGAPSLSGATKPSAAAGAGSARSTTAADSCAMRDKIQVCDPISNTGCLAELGMQCDVDLLATLSGVCVFSAPAPDPNACLNIPPTETCPPQTTCVGTTCLKVCVCDSDCDEAQRCSMPLGGGFQACEAR